MMQVPSPYRPRDNSARLYAANRAAYWRRWYIAQPDRPAANAVELLSWAVLCLLKGDRPIHEESTREIQRLHYTLFYDALDQQAVKELFQIIKIVGKTCLIARKENQR